MDIYHPLTWDILGSGVKELNLNEPAWDGVVSSDDGELPQRAQELTTAEIAQAIADLRKTDVVRNFRRESYGRERDLRRWGY